MKKGINVILIFALLVLTIVFGVLWQKEKNDTSKIKNLAQSEAEQAYESFTEYESEKDDSNYWDGVAAFRSFEQAYYILVEDTNKESNYTFCNEVYGYLVSNPKESQEHIKDVIEVMELLVNDIEDVKGYNLMSMLRNKLG